METPKRRIPSYSILGEVVAPSRGRIGPPDGGEFGDARASRWRRFLAAYRDSWPIDDRDVAAIGPFMAVRQVWLLGETAGRLPVWGSQTLTTDDLRRQRDLLRRCEDLPLPC